MAHPARYTQRVSIASGRAVRVRTRSTRGTALRCRFALSHQPQHAQDRVLRYPDGVVRTIRYPVPAQYADSVHAAGDAKTEAPERTASPSGAAEWHICGDNDVGCLVMAAYDVDSSLPGAAPVGDLWGDEQRVADVDSDQDLPLQPPEPVAEAGRDSDSSGDDAVLAAAADVAAPQRGREDLLPARRSPSDLPSSPAELLALFTSDEYRQRQQEHERRVRGSFSLLYGSPWVAPRELYVLAVQRAGQEHPAMYTLPTCVEQPGAQDGLAALLGADVAGRISVQHMRDGVVAFEDVAEIDGYRDALEAAGRVDVTTSRIDSHALFRAVGDTQGVVVLMGQGEVSPTPAELAAALRRKVAFDDL